ncbi:signal peptidase I [Clostridium formicaceticum]|uniref:Signal peptidase I n=1 Tax=Clostridium formicaceticum TaxID=1497 RepID=A0AAC9RLZ0_9CLOT|nr:signal peptidase I [Clostridium formicaceticum]AOY76330.1 signal peptidase I [Clostridium formicaceticum]ARE86720.1 Signal peptidase IB [Clostridium formicaceticum]
MKKINSYDYNLLKKIIIILGLFFIMNTFVLSIANVEGESMYPTLNPADRIVFIKLPYFRKNIKRGDVVIFTPPEELGREGELFVKRVAAVGEDMFMIEGGILQINSIEVMEDYICEEDYINKDYCHIKGIVPQNKFFVLGDNRNNSNDSRRFSCIGKHHIKGRVVLKIWPLHEITTFKNPHH